MQRGLSDCLVHTVPPRYVPSSFTHQLGPCELPVSFPALSSRPTLISKPWQLSASAPLPLGRAKPLPPLPRFPNACLAHTAPYRPRSPRRTARCPHRAPQLPSPSRRPEPPHDRVTRCAPPTAPHAAQRAPPAARSAGPAPSPSANQRPPFPRPKRSPRALGVLLAGSGARGEVAAVGARWGRGAAASRPWGFPPCTRPLSWRGGARGWAPQGCGAALRGKGRPAGAVRVPQPRGSQAQPRCVQGSSQPCPGRLVFLRSGWFYTYCPVPCSSPCVFWLVL